EPNPPRREDVSRHDAHFGRAWSDEPWTIRANQPRIIVFQKANDADHVVDGDALREAHNQLEPRCGGFHDRVGGARRWHENDGGIGPGRRDRLAHRVENWRPMYFAPAL